MIVYADTSALVKLFIIETDSQATRAMFWQAQALATGLLTRAELGAALARSAQRGIFSPQEAVEARRGLAAVWPTWIHIMLDETLAAHAEMLAWDYKLRGYDAVHLASALLWQDQLKREITIATFDQELWAAAQKTGLISWPPDYVGR